MPSSRMRISNCNVLIVWLSLILCTHHFPARAEQSCHPLSQCSCKLDDGRIISLWPIDQKNSARFTVGDRQSEGYTFNYNPCTPFTNSYFGSGECTNVLGCVSGGIGAGPFAIAYKEPLDVAYNSLIQMYKFTYTGSKSPGVVRKMVIQLKCDENAAVPSLETFEEAPSNTYTSTLTSKHACPGGFPKAHHKLSAGSILCIILFVLIFVYFVVGIVLNKFVLHKEGSDVIPQKKFWTDIPGLVKDGAHFSYRRMRGKTGEYQQL